MADFKPCLEWILLHEGYRTNDPDDLGGLTIWGITKHCGVDFDGKLYVDKMNIMTELESREFAGKVYRKLYWNLFNLDNEKDQKRAFCIFCSAVNPGQNAVKRWLSELGRDFKVEDFILKRCRFYIDRCTEDHPVGCHDSYPCRQTILMKECQDICRVGDAGNMGAEKYIHSIFISVQKGNATPSISCPTGHVCHSRKHLLGWLNATKDLLAVEV